MFKGSPPVKTKKNEEMGNTRIHGDVGLDIGTRTIAISSRTDVKIYELADRVQNIENKKCRLLRKLDRQRRANNPDNYNDDGTVRKQGSKRVIWVNSDKYKQTQKKLRELYRKQADVRKYQHECLTNEIISKGDQIYIEAMNYSL